MWKIVFMIIPAIPVVAWFIAFFVGVKPLRLGRKASLLIALALAAALGKFGFFAAFGGSAYNPDFPQGVIWAYGWAYAAVMIFTALLLAAAALDCAMRLCRRPVSIGARRIRTALMLAFAALVSLWGMYEGVCVPSVRCVELSWRELPPAFDGYRIVHLSDLHCSTAARRGRFEKIVERVNGLGADLIAITGDFVDGSVPDRGDDLSPRA